MKNIEQTLYRFTPICKVTGIEFADIYATNEEEAHALFEQEVGQSVRKELLGLLKNMPIIHNKHTKVVVDNLFF